jgi:hypothetical protein
MCIVQYTTYIIKKIFFIFIYSLIRAKCHFNVRNERKNEQYIEKVKIGNFTKHLKYRRLGFMEVSLLTVDRNQTRKSNAILHFW